ncbi:MAG TPA: FMN-binding negative transcriptional regulator [Pseudomonadales bacterium]
MYTPDAFLETRTDALHELIVQHPFATLITLDGGIPLINHLPLLLDPDRGPCGVLRGHVARANPLWQVLAQAGSATAVFHGPDGYVSPSWYPAKAEHHKVVPTWNYAVVHAQCHARPIEEADWLHRLIRDLTDRHEAAAEPPWSVDDAPGAFIETLVAQIVGIELTITGLSGKWKLSQNRSPADAAGVARGLRARGRPGDGNLATMMERYLS